VAAVAEAAAAVAAVADATGSGAAGKQQLTIHDAVQA
jgi:hypothetical protein